MRKNIFLIWIPILVLFFFTIDIVSAQGFSCNPLGGISNNYECTGAPPSQCVSLGNCTHSQCRDRAEGDTAKFGTNWYCCNAIKSISVGQCNITSVGNTINLLNPPSPSAPVAPTPASPSPSPAPVAPTAPSGVTSPAATCPEYCANKSLGEPTGTSCLCNPLGATTDFEILLNKIIDFIFWVGITLAPIMFIVAGLMYVLSAGNPQKVESAKKMMIYAAIGLAVLLLARGLVEVLKSIIGTVPST